MGGIPDGGGKADASGTGRGRAPEKIPIEKRFQPGDKLPDESELRAGFGVSRTTPREAIRSPIACDVVTVKRGLGTCVDHNGGPESVLMGAGDIFERRSIIEPGAAALAVGRASDRELSQIVGCGLRAGGKNNAGADRAEDGQAFQPASPVPPITNS